MNQRATVRAAICIGALLTLCGCGGGSDTVTSTTDNSGGSGTGNTGSGGGSTTGPEIIQGIATPSSVSVVTATNAQ